MPLFVPLTTDDAWQIYRRQMLYFLRLMPLGLLIAVLPNLFRLTGNPARGWWVSLGVSAIYGAVVPAAVWVTNGLVYGLRIRLGTSAEGWARYYWPFHLLVNALGLALGIGLSMALIQWLFRITYNHTNLLFSLFFGCVVMLVLVLYFAYRTVKEEALALRATVAEAKYQALEKQMQPHFLFNALNSLAELIEAGAPQAAATTYQLAELYRRILTNSATRTATLASELEIVRAYLAIEQLRFGERLRYEIRAPQPLPEIHLPSLVLQTLVENALKHGIAPTAHGGEVVVEIQPSLAGGWQARVSNTGRSLEAAAQPQAAEGAGLANTRARLALLYGAGPDAFTLRTDEAGRTVAAFSFSGERLA